MGGDNSDIGAFELQPTHHTRGNMNPHTNIRGATIGGATALLAIALVAFAALLMPHVAGASKERTRTVDATMKVAIIEQTEGANHFAGSITGKPGGTAAVLGVAAVTNTPTGVITESRPTLYYKRGTLRMKATDVVAGQPDGSISLDGTYEVLGGTGRYKGATGSGTFNGTLPPGSGLRVGTVVTFDVDGEVRY